MSYHVKSCRIMPYHVISYHILSCTVLMPPVGYPIAVNKYTIPYIISYHIISYHIISYHIILSYHVISCHIMPYHVISYHILSCTVLLPPVGYPIAVNKYIKPCKLPSPRRIFPLNFKRYGEVFDCRRMQICNENRHKQRYGRTYIQCMLCS